MRLYLAGPMRSIPHFNFPAFHKAAAELRACGHIVFSPAELGIIEDGDLSNHGRRQALCADLSWICKEADAIALLPGWEDSKGARAEKATAEALGLGIYRVADLVRLKEIP